PCPKPQMIGGGKWWRGWTSCLYRRTAIRSWLMSAAAPNWKTCRNIKPKAIKGSGDPRRVGPNIRVFCGRTFLIAGHGSCSKAALLRRLVWPPLFLCAAFRFISRARDKGRGPKNEWEREGPRPSHHSSLFLWISGSNREKRSRPRFELGRVVCAAGKGVCKGLKAGCRPCIDRNAPLPVGFQKKSSFW